MRTHARACSFFGQPVDGSVYQDLAIGLGKARPCQAKAFFGTLRILWTHSAPMDWANESFTIAEQARTEYCIRQGASCEQPAGKVTIDAAYVVANAPISVSSCRRRASGSRIYSMPLWASNSCVLTRPGQKPALLLVLVCG
jgi:hypothetical protein